MAEPAARVSWSEYVALDDAGPERHELVAGRVVVMASATPRHNRIVGNTFAALDRALRGKPYTALAGAPRVHEAATQLGAYPDVVVVCGKPEHASDGRSLVNPTLLVEVLSPSTEDYDRGAKLRHYMRLPSFVEYLVVASEERRVEHHRRLESGQWRMTAYDEPSDEIALPALDAAVSLGELYERVDEL